VSIAAGGPAFPQQFPRLAVLADVHGNLPALEAVLQDAHQQGADSILVAGDLVGGPQSNETTTLLSDLGACMIRGNSDSAILRYLHGDAPPDWRTRQQYALLRWGACCISEATRETLEALPEQRVFNVGPQSAIRLVHGSPRDPCESLFPDLEPEAFEQALAEFRETVLVCGHTHVPWQRRRGGQLAMNPGAVGGPLNGDTRAQFAILSWDGKEWQVEPRAIPYDLKRIREAFRLSGLLEEGGPLAQAFLLSIETARDVSLAFLTFAQEVKAGFPHADPIPDSAWEQAAAAFDWSSGGPPVP
jgi:putative phosphoesterase